MSIDERRLELMVDQLDRPLESEERRELVRALSEEDSWHPDEIELAATAAMLAELEAEGASFEAMPASLSAKLAAAAAEVLLEPAAVTAPRPLEPIPPAPRPQRAPTSGKGEPTKSSMAWIGWAAAAALALAWLWSSTRSPSPAPSSAPETSLAAASGAACPACPEPEPPPPLPTPSERREELLDAPEALRLAWTKTEDPMAGQASGDVVWDDARQEGYMRFVDLPVNDPKQAQYQLWIFDEGRSDATPVDGGVFDVSAAGEVIVPIDAKVPVDKAVMFAVTVERPGGVVVSEREHIVTLAKLG